MEEEPRSYIRLGRFVLVLFILVLLSSLLIKGPFKGWLNWSTFNFVFRSHGLSQIVSNNLSQKEGDFAIFIENLKTDEKFSQNADTPFPSASLYKLYLMAAVLKEVDSGQLTVDSTVSSTKSRLVNVYGSVDSGYDNAPENISYTVDEALTRIGRVSDNFASIMLTDKIGLDKIQQMADELGAKNTKIKDPTLVVVEGEDPYISTTAFDIGLFFKKLYREEIISASASAKLAEFLSLNQLDDRIPAGIPEGVKVIHKTGELARVRHDAGIVYLPEKEYVIVLMSQNIRGEETIIETFANLSKEVYEYFSSEK